jgi:hypothetical protein
MAFKLAIEQHNARGGIQEPVPLRMLNARTAAPADRQTAKHFD